MPKFAVHMFEEVRRKFIVEAESIDAIKAMLDDETIPFKLDPVEGDATGNYTKALCIDPLLDNGEVDYENSQWVRLHFGGGEAMYIHYSFISECIAEVERIPIRASLGDRPSNLEKLAYELLKSSAYIE